MKRMCMAAVILGTALYHPTKILTKPVNNILARIVENNMWKIACGYYILPEETFQSVNCA